MLNINTCAKLHFVNHHLLISLKATKGVSIQIRISKWSDGVNNFCINYVLFDHK